MQISPSLVSAYQELCQQYNTSEYQERIQEILTVVKARGFQPSDLTDNAALSEVKKGGIQA